jgi:phosphopantothenoylcysteine synthetase/decarboxylase
VLISGPVSLPAPAGAEIVRVLTTQEMLEAVAQRCGEADVCILCAAVCDYRPLRTAEQKIKKSSPRMTLELERTTDILGSLRSPLGFRGILIGFAAETENLLANAREKLSRKGCDLIMANAVGQPGIGFDADENAGLLVFADGRVEEAPRQAKSSLAEKLVGVAADLVEKSGR